MNDMQKLLHGQLAKRIEQLPLQIILEIFEATEIMPTEPELVLLRDLILEELDKRNPSAFKEWLECVNSEFVAKPSHFFNKQI